MFPYEDSKIVSSCPFPQKRYHLSFVPVVIDTSMERYNRSKFYFDMHFDSKLFFQKRRSLEREKAVMEKRHTLPETPMILVHPSRSAKSGKFDATTMSLSVLLDYRQVGALIFSINFFFFFF